MNLYHLWAYMTRRMEDKILTCGNPYCGDAIKDQTIVYDLHTNEVYHPSICPVQTLQHEREEGGQRRVATFVLVTRHEAYDLLGTNGKKPHSALETLLSPPS